MILKIFYGLKGSLKRIFRNFKGFLWIKREFKGFLRIFKDVKGL